MLRSILRLESRFSKITARSFSELTLIDRIRNIDSGKTTLTERILFYTGRINKIHDVRGKDGVGAKMDSMELEREKGITIQSAATFCNWKDSHINIIDTPGHVDFTIEVERALRVLDGAILVLCSVSGVQSQTLTVDRQMKRYNIPRLAFINKLDRAAANPKRGVKGLRDELRLPAVPVQIPIGLEENHKGVVDIINRKAIYFEGDSGEDVQDLNVPPELHDECETARKELIERLADLDEEIAEIYLADEEPSVDQITAAVRRQTILLKFVPVFMGSAYKNKGIQPLLDGVIKYLASPNEKKNFGLDLGDGEKEVPIPCDPNLPLIALAFKLQETKFGQLTYMRIYQGTLMKGNQATNLTNGRKSKFPRLVRMHSNEMEDIESAGAGDVVAVFGLECASMDTFTDGKARIAMQSMFVPKPVMSLAVKPKDPKGLSNFGKALGKFTREDPTLQMFMDNKTGETILSGMGELHLNIYVERLKREFNVECITGSPKVNYKETISSKGEFNYLHKKQSGGAGQYARVIGFIEPLDDDSMKDGTEYEFENRCAGTNIPSEFYPSCEKGAANACKTGALAGFPLTGVRVVLLDGASHIVDSNDMAFQLAMRYGIREAVHKAKPQILEPIMNLEVQCPSEFQGVVMGGISKRNGVIESSEMSDDGALLVIRAEIALAELFGYSTDLRSGTQGKGEFTMEYKSHKPASKVAQMDLIAQHQERLKKEQD